jgi:hypothetical protein
MTKSIEEKMNRMRRSNKPYSNCFHPKSGITVRGIRVSTPENRNLEGNPMIFLTRGRNPWNKPNMEVYYG